jgi:uncharacterized membrane protein YqiK
MREWRYEGNALLVSWAMVLVIVILCLLVLVFAAVSICCSSAALSLATDDFGSKREAGLKVGEAVQQQVRSNATRGLRWTT